MTDERATAAPKGTPSDARRGPTARQSRPRFLIDNLGLAWLFLLIGTFSYTHRAATDVLSGQLTSSNLIRFGCIVIAFALITPELRARIALRLNPLWLFAAYVAICVLSAVWSVSPLATLGKAAELAVATSTVLLAANRPSAARALNQLLLVTFAFGALVLLVVAIGFFLGLPGFWIPSKGVFGRQMEASFLSANNVGFLSALTATVSLDRALGRAQGRWLMWAAFLLSIATAFAAQGRTGWVCLVLGTVGVLTIRGKFKVLLIGGALALLVALAFNEQILSYLTRGEPAGSLTTLTGRTVIWEGAWQSFLQRPLTGNGFGIGGRYLFVSVFAGSGEDWSMAHNGVLELLTGVGLIGFVPWIAAFIWTFANAFRFAARRLLAGVPAIIGLMPVITLMSNGPAGWFDIQLGYFLCCVAILAHRLPRRAPASHATRRIVQPAAVRWDA